MLAFSYLIFIYIYLSAPAFAELSAFCLCSLAASAASLLPESALFRWKSYTSFPVLPALFSSSRRIMLKAVFLRRFLVSSALSPILKCLTLCVDDIGVLEGYIVCLSGACYFPRLRDASITRAREEKLTLKLINVRIWDARTVIEVMQKDGEFRPGCLNQCRVYWWTPEIIGSDYIIQRGIGESQPRGRGTVARRIYGISISNLFLPSLLWSFYPYVTILQPFLP